MINQKLGQIHRSLSALQMLLLSYILFTNEDELEVYLRFFRMIQAPMFIAWLFKKRFSFGDIRFSIATILNVFGVLYSIAAFAAFTYGGLLTAFLTYFKTESLLQAFGMMLIFLAYAIGIPYLWKKAFILKQ